MSPLTDSAHAVIVRRYAPADLLAVRQLSCETADRGAPLDRLFRDRELTADLLTRYYTHYEPTALWVAAAQEQLVGYLTGCLNTRRYLHTMWRHVVPQSVMRGLMRGVLWHPETWRLLWAGMHTWRVGGFVRRTPLERYPAHLHLNIRQGFRGQQIGRRLVDAFLQQVRDTRLHGIHAVVHQDNAAACQFFERMEFRPFSRHPIITPTERLLRVSRTVVYVRHVS